MKILLGLFLLIIGTSSFAQNFQAQTIQMCIQTATGCIVVNNNNPFPVTQAPLAPLPTNNNSVTIAVGNSFQQVLSMSTNRKAFTVINNNTNGDNCWLFIGNGLANKGNSIVLPQFGQYIRNQGVIPSDVIQVTCSTTRDTVYVDSQ